MGGRGVHRPDLRHGSARAAAGQAHRPPHRATVVAHRGAGRRGRAVAGGEPGAGRTFALGVDHGGHSGRAFLAAVSMLERRAAMAGGRTRTAATPPPSFGRPSSALSPSTPSSFGSSARPSAPSSSSSPDTTDGDAHRPGLAVVGASGPDQDDTRDRDQDGGQDGDAREDGAQDNGGQTALPVPAPAGRRGGSSQAGPLLEFARRVAAEHQATHGRPITRDALRARLGVSNQLASGLLRQIRDQTPNAA